jgi:hypothetical protein
LVDHLDGGDDPKFHRAGAPTPDACHEDVHHKGAKPGRGCVTGSRVDMRPATERYDSFTRPTLSATVCRQAQISRGDAGVADRSLEESISYYRGVAGCRHIDAGWVR